MKKHNPKIKQEINYAKSNLLPHLQPFKQKLFSGNCFVEYHNRQLSFFKNCMIWIHTSILKIMLIVLLFIKELRKFSIIR